MSQQVWMDPQELACIEKYTTPETVMLEWGAGGSTTYFGDRVKKLYSIEHNLDWYNKMRSEIRPNTTLWYRPISKPLPPVEDYHQSEYQHYKEYLDAIHQIAEPLDVVFVDGRARRLCAIKALSKLKTSGVLIIHDWCNRPPYHCVLDYYNLIDKVDTTTQTVAVFTKKPWDQICYNFSDTYNINLATFARLDG